MSTTVDHLAAPAGARTLLDHDYRQLIDGRLVPGATTQEVIDPATGAVIGVAPVADADQIEAAVGAASAAFGDWSSRSLDDRAAVLGELIAAVEARREEIGRTIVLEVGKPWEAAVGDVDLALSWARHVAGMRLDPVVAYDDDERYVEVRRKPLGVVVAIVPWNFPFFQAMYKIVPALLAGNTVVVKPAPTTPLNAMLLGEILAGVVPAGVVNIIGDAGNVGPILTAHPAVRKVSFTGSTAAGRSVLASGASTIKRVVLELGGNDPAIVMPDASVDAVVDGIATWAFANTGQVCLNIKRVFVPDALYDEFCERFTERARGFVVGHGLDPETDLGPIQNRRQFETVKGHLELAAREGTVIAGGSVIEGRGFLVEPTVVRDIDDASPLVAEETFGPIRSILRYSDLDDAITRANSVDYGLGASVWGTDVTAATAVADRLQAGTTWVNTHFALDPAVPFGGRKQSGLGVEFGQEGLEEFTDPQVIYVARQQAGQANGSRHGNDRGATAGVPRCGH
ncbi:aldehyde dehydrogenase family protein [Gordonia sp. PP30]|uniref:aldehyde dehydrogenase family protein n=1 Tax=Gordonia sp. PP30 TaxID=2935861 RepID=UPI002000191B|nr:aldehyde dehydrogenase family protein [Gordonia sp. PP30]UQE76183.1 aldehyde dehydrogenase family protein [Gordonia sp. PP30]